MRRLNKTYPYQKQLKNRSSKDNNMLTGPGTKPWVRCCNGAMLKKLADADFPGASAEIERRQKRRDKKGL